MTEEADRAWRAALIAEAAAVYGYASAGPVAEDVEAARQRYDEHLADRDAALTALTAAGADDLAVPTVFEIPALPTAGAVADFLADLESRLVQVWADLVPVTSAAERRWVLGRIEAATTSAMRWGARTGPWGPTGPPGRS